VNCLSREAPDVLCGNVFEATENGMRVVDTRINSDYQLYRETICHQALFTARHIFETVGLFDITYRICADREWLVRALKTYKLNLYYVDVPICIYDNSGVSSRERLQLRLENIKINHKQFKWQFYPFLLKQFVDKIRLLAV
jgi:hypothetical protein